MTVVRIHHKDTAEIEELLDFSLGKAKFLIYFFLLVISLIIF